MTTFALAALNHNRAVRKVLELNELNKWTQCLSKLTPGQRRIQIDEIFGTAGLRANYYLIPEVDGPKDLGQDSIQSLKDLVKHDEPDKKGFENLKIQEIYCRHGLEASCLNHWKPILKGFVVKGENLNQNSADQAIGAINDQLSLTCV
ncbi:hypothetical protein BY996DRAFT_6408529 [Phakopsora pachyrhizi]|nr:hypothetical protein BY996DRAFT_6408529 [Phakopsora pachyrhizi]